MEHEPKQLQWAHLPEVETPPTGWMVKGFSEIANVIAGQLPTI